MSETPQPTNDQQSTVYACFCGEPVFRFYPDTPRGIVGRHEWFPGAARVRRPGSPIWGARCAAHQEGMVKD